MLQNNQRIIECGVFFLLIVVSWLALPDIPLSRDTGNSRKVALSNIEHAKAWFAGERKKIKPELDEHGPIFELFLLGIEKAVFSVSKNALYRDYARQITIRTLFLVATLFFYLLACKYFKDWRIALAFAAVFSLCPRIFNHSFHNSFDIGFLSMSTICLWSLFQLIQKRSVRNACLHGLLCALATDIRVAGGIFALITLAYLAYVILAFRTRTQWSILSAFLFSYGFFLVVFWPFLWAAPISRLFWTIWSNAYIGLPLHQAYMGKIYSNFNPWHFHLVWIGITVPLSLLLLSVLGMVKAFAGFYLHPRQLSKEKVFSCCLFLWFVTPVFIAVAKGSNFYDGWRHCYFLFPNIVLLAGTGLLWINEKLSSPKLSYVFLSIYLSFNVYDLIRLHPYQNIYFNQLGKAKAQNQFEKDYWCQTCVQGVKELLTKTTGTIAMHPHPALSLNQSRFSNEEWQRIKWTYRKSKGTYRVLFYYGTVGEYDFPFSKEVHNLSVAGLKVLSIHQYSDS